MSDQEDYQLYVPARGVDPVPGQVTIYLQQPRQRHFPWWAVLLGVVLVGVLVFLLRLAVVEATLDQFDKVDASLRAPVAAPVPHYLAGSSPQFPPSMTLRLRGTVDTGSGAGFVAVSGAGAFVVIPSKDCAMVSGSPVCHFQGRSVTRFTGVSGLS